MSYATAIAALTTAFEATSVNYVLDYEPTAIHDAPMLYLLLDGFERDTTVQPVRYTYRVLATLVIRWQDNEQAEKELLTLVNEVADALDADIGLGGALGGGVALVTGGDAGYATISGTIYRVVEYVVEVTEISC